jgi:hypothetical protein
LICALISLGLGGNVDLEAIVAQITGLDDTGKKELADVAMAGTKGMVFIPSPGPQTDAYISNADVLLFGGSPGGGKTALEVGLALNEHHRTLIVRREFVDLTGVLHTLDNILATPQSATGGNRPVYRKPGSDGGIIEFMGMGNDIGKFQGNPHDLICIDEAAQIPENDVRMLMGWMRTDREGQRCRVVLGSNPPLDSVGDWMIDFFAPWLDHKYSNPAMEGELRWFLPKGKGGCDVEVEESETMMLHGVEVAAQSRTYISSQFSDNPFYSKEDYAKSLSALPAEIRKALMSGNFLTNRSDDIWQAIPTDWVRQAQSRWTERPEVGVPMCAIGVDVAQGGSDNTVLAIRHDGWFAPLQIIPGVETPDGATVASHVVKNRMDDAVVIVDLGGGWGGGCFGHLKENRIESIGYMGVKTSPKKSIDGKLSFTNVRSASYWGLREALDPGQPGGSSIMLPYSSKLLAELTAPTYEVTSSGIKLMSKEKVCDKLGRSPDEADAVVMAWSDGPKKTTHALDWIDRKQRKSGRYEAVSKGRTSLSARRRK